MLVFCHYLHYIYLRYSSKNQLTTKPFKLWFFFKNFNEAISQYDYICKFSQIVIQRLDLNPKEEVMALFLSAPGTGYAANYQSEINDHVFRKEFCLCSLYHHYPFNSFTFNENYHLRMRNQKTGYSVNEYNNA